MRYRGIGKGNELYRVHKIRGNIGNSVNNVK